MYSALFLDYFIDSYLHDRVKYNFLCQEAHLLAKDMNWEQFTMEYYELLNDKKIT
ncbi:MAG: hypothetical protein ACLFMM_03370 [Methanohalobium sp.]|uniref:hypothetical protein n=1 Tax=Methanohalobium sp. TaxID=2837493 RepID=UPI00397B5CCD